MLPPVSQRQPLADSSATYFGWIAQRGFTSFRETWTRNMGVLLLEDSAVPQLDPITLTRPAYAISCGGSRLLDMIQDLGPPVSALVRPRLAPLEMKNRPHLRFESPPPDRPLLVLNARLVPCPAIRKRLQSLTRQPCSEIALQNAQVAAAWLPTGIPASAMPTTPENWDRWLRQSVTRQYEEPDKLHLFEYPHDVIRYHRLHLGENLQVRLSQNAYREVSDGVFLAADARLGEYVVTDTTQGPIVLEPHAAVGPHSFLRGPLLLEHEARICEGASVKDAVTVGHATRIGGEVASSTLEAYSNKQHSGFLGDSYVGSWVNLGAGTCVSNLKNTYGTVRVVHNGHKIDTGMQFLGAVFGDYAKSAINTSVFTGKRIGVGSALYGMVTSNVPSFVNYAPQLGSVTAMTADVIVDTQRRIFARRNVPQRLCDVQLLQDLFQLTAGDRHGLPSGPPTF